METRGQRSDAYHKLREAIVSGQYHPNERLVEASIAQRMGAGRTAVRAALVRLDQEGLVEIEPNRGARVRLISDREALEIEEVRAALEGMLARRAATRVTAEDLSALRQVITEMRERVEAGDSIGYSELNATFHQAYTLMSSAKAREAFSIKDESGKTRERYGMNRFGQSCLLARRLIERGVRFVTVNMFETVFNEITWDIHGSKPFSPISSSLASP